MARLMPILAAAAIVLGAGIVHGLWSDRWYVPAGVEQAVAALERIPKTIGGRVGTDLPQNKKVLLQAEIAGSLLRRYEDRRKQSVVTVQLVCGRSGPIATHPPEICLGGAGYQMASSPDSFTVTYGTPEQTGEFEVARFDKPESPTAPPILVVWGWTARGDWEVPENPRLRFASEPILYKLYLTRPVTGEDARAGIELNRAFLQDLLPAIAEAVFSPPATGPTTTRQRSPSRSLVFSNATDLPGVINVDPERL